MDPINKGISEARFHFTAQNCTFATLAARVYDDYGKFPYIGRIRNIPKIKDIRKVKKFK